VADAVFTRAEWHNPRPCSCPVLSGETTRSMPILEDSLSVAGFRSRDPSRPLAGARGVRAGNVDFRVHRLCLCFWLAVPRPPPHALSQPPAPWPFWPRALTFTVFTVRRGRPGAGAQEGSRPRSSPGLPKPFRRCAARLSRTSAPCRDPTGTVGERFRLRTRSPANRGSACLHREGARRHPRVARFDRRRAGLSTACRPRSARPAPAASDTVRLRRYRPWTPSPSLLSCAVRTPGTPWPYQDRLHGVSQGPRMQPRCTEPAPPPPRAAAARAFSRLARHAYLLPVLIITAP